MGDIIPIEVGIGAKNTKQVKKLFQDTTLIMEL